MSGSLSHFEKMTHDPLIAAALLGSARSAVLPPPPDESLQNIWDALAALDPADAILQALAMTRALHRGGGKLRTEEEVVPSSTAESLDPFPPGAVDVLMRLLKGEFPEVLPEWLAFAAGSRRVLPGRVLPELLAAGAKDPSLRPGIRQLAGERGLWVARRYDKFLWIIDDQNVMEEAWEDGSPVERITWLRQTRTKDPAKALEAVISHWPGEDPSMRESILRVIFENPLPSDESWLEQHVLNDRRQEVRGLAVASLVCIPDSAFRWRALERVRSRVTLQSRLQNRVIMVEPPEKFDPSWSADGMKEKPPQGTGEKAWWLRQMIAAVPLDEWPELLGCGPDELFGFAMDQDWKEPLLLGWIDAAIRIPARALAERFVPFLAALDPWPVALPPKTVVISSLLDAQPAAKRVSLLDGIAKTLPASAAIDLLVRCPTAPAAGGVKGEGEAMLAVIDDALVSTPTQLNRPQARALALSVPQEGIPERLERLAKLPDLSPAAEEFATTLEFRRSLAAHFKQS
jgi:hypothetical protein